MSIDYSPILSKLIRHENLTGEETGRFMNDCMDGNLNPIQAGAILTALSMKGETIEEITACARIMREKSTSLILKKEVMVDCVGTGGDRSGTFNISTAAGFVVAAAGYTVAKHGNRSVTSQCGSADVIEALGVDLGSSVERVREAIESVGFGFLFAPFLHTAMKNVVPIRRELKIRTIFNILGPMTNPAGANTSLIGLFAEELLDPIAQSLKNLGARSFYLVHGEDGLDEVSGASNTLVRKMFVDGKIESFVFNPLDYGFERCSLEDLKGGNAEENAAVLRRIFESVEQSPKTETVIMNAGFALSAAGNVSLKEGFEKARQTIASGKVAELLRRYVQTMSQG